MKFADILSTFRQGKGTARSHMKNLIEMAAADGHFHDAEFELLKTIGKRNGISESQLKEIRSNSTGIQFEVPTDKKEKFHQLYDLVHMMSIDNSIHPDEQKLCEIFALKFGYQSNSVGDLLSTIRANIKNGQGHDEAMKRVELMLN